MSKQEKKNLENKPKSQKITIGSIIEISIEGKYFVYAQILPKSLAFFDYRSIEPIRDFSCLNTAPVLFVIPVYDYVITKGIWLKVGKMPIREDLERLSKKYYIYDEISGKYSKYDSYTGEIVSSSKEDVRGLERAAVWAENHVEDRIRDYYNHVPCLWLKEHYELFPEFRPGKKI